MLSEALPFFIGKLFLSTAPFSIFNDQSFFITLLLVAAAFFGTHAQFISIY